ncbi:MAG: hypothetical protein ACYST5_20225 [Planctomycetota bacterium]
MTHIKSPIAPVKGTSDRCKTVEFPMKACWKEDGRLGSIENIEIVKG